MGQLPWLVILIITMAITTPITTVVIFCDYHLVILVIANLITTVVIFCDYHLVILAIANPITTVVIVYDYHCGNFDDYHPIYNAIQGRSVSTFKSV